MVAKCANPECEARFLYFGVGQLFVTYDHETRKAPARDSKTHPKFFWLCEDCSLHMALHFDIDGSPLVLPRTVPDWDDDFPVAIGSQMSESRAG